MSALEKLKTAGSIKTEIRFQNVELWVVDLNSFKSILATKDKINQLERLRTAHYIG
ncbi:hypothetical protein PQX77_014146 [Marasmius sp. AFHP31]|nr:hypothetical protein PQX77_014146 [Marasmius sp. AFHP31]